MKVDSEVKIEPSRKRLYPTGSINYLDIKIEENLNWKHHGTDISIKLNRVNALLFKIRSFVNANTLFILQKKGADIYSFSTTRLLVRPTV